ncbi:HDOD domain-containing protein [Lysobacter sp. A286]
MFIVIAGEDAGQADELKLALSDFGLDWQVEYAADAAAVITLDRPVDVLVTDLGLHGSEVLTELRAKYPDAVRILLLERGQGGEAVHALDGAHRVLHKPLDGGELIDAVEGFIDLRLLLDNEELKRSVGQVESLPPAPRMYIELVQLMRDPDVSMAEIAYVLSQDPALAAKVLRLCNSAFFSAGREITDIRSAVTRLGLGMLGQLVLVSEALGGSGESDQETSGVDREAMQWRALATSQLARKLLAGPSAELAATAGLLAEVGLLLPGIGGEVAPDLESEPDVDMDIRIASPGYAEAGAYLLGLWGLPMPIVEAVAHQSRPRRMRSTGFWVTGAVHVASALVRNTQVDEGYLHSVGVIDKLPQWRLMAEQIGQNAEAA